MFKNNPTSNGTSTPQDPDSPERLNRIVEGTSIEGEMKCDSNVRIDGKIKGTVETKGRLVIGPSGLVEGDVICNNGDIEGKVEGRVKVQELLSLKSTAKLNGDIYTKKLAIEPGAEFTGSCNMDASSSNTPKQPQQETGQAKRANEERGEQAPKGQQQTVHQQRQQGEATK